MVLAGPTSIGPYVVTESMLRYNIKTGWSKDIFGMSKNSAEFKYVVDCLKKVFMPFDATSVNISATAHRAKMNITGMDPQTERDFRKHVKDFFAPGRIFADAR